MIQYSVYVHKGIGVLEEREDTKPQIYWLFPKTVNMSGMLLGKYVS